MHASVPQFVDVEDKIAFGLTGKQLLWMGAMGGTLVIAYSLLDRQTFYITAVFIVMIFGSFTFWRPQGVSMITFLGFAIVYFTKPRNYIWKRTAEKQLVDVRKAQDEQRRRLSPVQKEKKLPPASQLKRIAWMLDTGGRISEK